jgi:hypothetical protein
MPPQSGATMCGWAVRDGDNNAHSMVGGFMAADGRDGSMMFDGDGTTLAVWAAGAGVTTFTNQPAAGQAFFWALTIQTDANVFGFIRRDSDRTLESQSEPVANWSISEINLGDGPSFDRNYPMNGRVWNVKCWDRVLTNAELLVESYYRRVMFPASINFHWPLDRHDDLNDYSGNGRAATAVGTLSTEDGGFGLWRPRRRIFIPAASGAQTLSPSGVATAEAFGTATIAKGGVSITPSGIASAEAFGTTVLTSVRILSPSGIASAESFGAHTLSVGGVTIVPNAIVTGEAFGSHVVATNATIIAPNGIASLEAHGTATLVRGGVVITPSGIVSLEQFGSVVIAGAVTAAEARRYLGLLARLHRR